MIAGRNCKSKLFFGVLTIMALVFSGVAAQDAESFYKDKIITLLVGFNPGGGYDAYARLLAPFLEQETGATVVVKNRPGGGSLVAMNQVYTAKPDGLTIMLIPGHSAAVAQVTNQEGARFDVTTFAWLARVAKEIDILFAGAKSPYRSLDDLVNSDRPIRFAGGRGSGHIYFFLCKALSLDCTFVSGYRGIKEMGLAVIRGEADVFAMPEGTARAFAQGDKLLPVAAFGRKRSTRFSEAPALLELDQLSADQVSWLKLEDDIRALGRALVTTPGTPEDRVTYLRRAVERVLADPEVHSAAARIGRPLNYLSGQEAQTLAWATLDLMNSEMREEIRAVLLGGTN
jgi:tripartite-type tricarboxylate transporter receptor subunit TctC